MACVTHLTQSSEQRKRPQEIHLRFPQYLPNRAARLYAKTMMRTAARRARRVLTVSQASKEDILRYLHVPAEKVEVIYNALDERLAAPPTSEDIARVRERFQLTRSNVSARSATSRQAPARRRHRAVGIRRRPSPRGTSSKTRCRR